MRDIKTNKWWSWFGFLRSVPGVLAISSGSLSAARDAMFLVTGTPTPADAHGSAMSYLRICFIVSSVGAWLIEHKKVRELATRIDTLKARAELCGHINDAVCIGEPSEYKTLVLMRASIWNESSHVSPSIRGFVCEVEFDGHSQWCSAQRESPFIKWGAGELVNLAYFQGCLIKHQHQEGHLDFLFHGSRRGSDGPGRIRLHAIDGAGIWHLLCERAWPYMIERPRREVLVSGSASN